MTVSPSPAAAGGQPHTAFRVPAHPTAVRTVRRAARVELRGWGVPDAVCDDVELIISELVTNAIVHTVSDSVTCRLRGGPEIRVEVGSEGRAGTQGDARPPGEGGRGLVVVEALSTSWGIDVATPGAGWTAWATVTVSAPAARHGEDPR
ncbi:ATP-binding protein [Streptomyces sp. NBC_01476]|uniref:ATP-binding protein n=1 Tax=Streptomyces sp. NBC_01476 TaxID=2903881 RepID=UPI002E2F7CBC|nr:ATP-binding protein [Streptomyces sp. NBC_01476]